MWLFSNPSTDAAKRAALLAGLLLLVSFAAHADGPRKYVTISPAFGTATVDVGGYDSVNIFTLDAEYHVTPTVGVALGLRGFEDFETTGETSARLDLDHGIELAAVLTHRPTERVWLKVRGGVMKYLLTAHALDRKIGEEEDYAPTLGFTGQLEFNQWFGLQLDARRAFNVSDAALDWVSLGVFVRIGRREPR